MKTLVGAAEPPEPEHPGTAWIPLNSAATGSGQSTVVVWQDGAGHVVRHPWARLNTNVSALFWPWS